MDENYWESIKVVNRDKFEKFSQTYETISNKIYIDVTKVLITLNTALLAFTSPLVSGERLVNKFDLKFLIVLIWCLLGGSLISGIIQLIIEHYYFKQIGTLYGVLSNIFNESEPTKEGISEAFRKGSIESQKQFKAESSQIAFWFQIILFATSLILLIYVFSKSI